ncbi:MAG: glycosyltransferase family 4 protein [Desulfobacula sp.]|nr:glycosyltransferase family 4 protein [Desulfobacula sp.]
MAKDLDNLFKNKRIIYFKHGNTVKEIQQLSSESNEIYAGFSTYISQFFKLFSNKKTLIISFLNKDATIKVGPCQAVTVKEKYSNHSFFGPLFNMIRNAFLAFRYLSRFKPDFIICANYRAVLWACYLYHKLSGAVLVHSRHNRLISTNRFPNNITCQIDSFIIRRVPFVICHGRHLKKELLNIGVNEKRICVFGPNYRSLIEASKSANFDMNGITEGGQKTLIGFLGRIESAKGVFDLLAACQKRLHEDKNLRLVYLGSGSALEDLAKQIIDNNIDSQVKCLGWVNPDRIPGIIKQCKFVVTPSQSRFPEGFPKSAVEPLILGKPVIAPDYGPFSHFIIHEYNGLIFKSDSVDSLQKNITRLLDDHDLYEKLSINASISGKKLVDPPKSFADSIVFAFQEALRLNRKAF